MARMKYLFWILVMVVLIAAGPASALVVHDPAYESVGEPDSDLALSAPHLPKN